MGSVTPLRWALVAAGAIFALLLLSRGFVLAGIILLVMAGLRAALVFTTQRRRRAFLAQRGPRADAWRARRGGPQP